MVAGAPQQQEQPYPQSQQQQQQLLHQHQQQPIPSAQEEALKRNTDCVYFLASPLTCKKGSECEYRHSEYARVNPRDCWYWLNGNCLNPKCSFRHPPLDGFLGTQVTPPSGSGEAPSQPAMTNATHPHNSSKQAVPCIFFPKGICLKGDRCAFLHGPNPNIGNKVPLVLVANQRTEPLTRKKAFGGGLEKTQERKIPQANIVKPIGNSEANPVQKMETASQRIVGVERHMAVPPTQLDYEASRVKLANAPPVANAASVARSNRLNQGRMLDDPNIHNAKDSDEFMRESSPGFDVLVEDELTNSDYYHGEDQFGKARGQDGRNLDSVDEYDLGHSAGYNSVAEIDRERFRAPQGYGSYDHRQEQYVWGQERNSSDRMFGASAHLGRNRHKSDSPENVEVSDLRFQLSKRRRVNGLKSVVNHDYYDIDSHGDEQSYQFSSRKDSHQLHLSENSLSNRFRGRIKLPEIGSDDHLERESDRTRSRSRLSPGRQQAPHPGQLRDRVRGRVQDDYERKNYRPRPMRREIMSDESTDFAGPKSLAELKGERSTENKEHQSLRKRKGLQNHHQPEDDLQFEGPKPLSEILKEKRGAEAGAAITGFQSNKLSGNKSDNKDTEATNCSHNIVVSDTEHGILLKEESKFQVTDTVGNDTDKTYSTHGHSSEDGMIYNEGMEEQEYEADDQRNGDGGYDYEQGDEGEYNYEEGENPEQEEYVDDEDGDDFAKKIGVVLA